jgi:hypothetical protein
MARIKEALDGHAVACPAVFHDAKGEPADMALVLVPIMVGGTVGRLLGFAENITERQRFERELYSSAISRTGCARCCASRISWRAWTATSSC